MTIARMPARIAWGSSGQATMALQRRHSGFPRVWIEKHATVVMAYGEAAAAGGVSRRERVRGNLVDMVVTGRRIAYNLDHPVQVIRIGKHLSVTVDDSEQAHGAESSILDPFSRLV